MDRTPAGAAEDSAQRTRQLVTARGWQIHAALQIAHRVGAALTLPLPHDQREAPAGRGGSTELLPHGLAAQPGLDAEPRAPATTPKLQRRGEVVGRRGDDVEVQPPTQLGNPLELGEQLLQDRIPEAESGCGQRRTSEGADQVVVAAPRRSRAAPTVA